MKRIIALAVCLLMLCPAALGEIYVVENYGTEERAGCSLLVRDDGTLLTPMYTYSTIYQITPQGMDEEQRLYGVASFNVDAGSVPDTGSEEDYDMYFARLALMNAQGRLLTGFDYDGFEYGCGYVVFTVPGEDRAVGAMDTEGNVVMEPEYAALKPLPGGRWLALAQPEDPSAVHRTYYDDGGYYDEIDYELQFIDSDGQTRALGLHTRDRYFNVNEEGISAVWNVVEYDGGTVFIDADGSLMFDRSFQYADNFIGDYAVAEEDRRYGVIDRTGAWVIEPEYDYINAEAGKPWIATRGGSFVAYDPEDLRVRTAMTFEGVGDVSVAVISPELLGVTAGKSRRIYTVSGALLTEAPEGAYIQMYGNTGDGVNRLVSQSGDWPNDMCRLIDLEGNVVSGDYQVLYAGSWRGGRGHFVTGTYDLLPDADGDYLIDWNSYRFGVIDENGGTVLPPVYDQLQPLDYDRFWVSQGPRSGLIDDAGKWYCTVSDYEMLMD